MATAEIKKEIQKVLDEVPETVLEDILNFLKELQKYPEEKVKTAIHIKKILSEDKNLLHRLAQ